MSNTTEHPYAHILRAIAGGQKIQWQDSLGRWLDQEEDITLHEIGRRELAPGRYRVKPRTITINGREVPEPLRAIPEIGVMYWIPRLAVSEGAVGPWQWSGDKADKTALSRGLVHLTEEGARAHAEALLSFTAEK